MGILKKVKSMAMAAGLLSYPAGGTIDGEYGEYALLALPLILEDEQIDERVDKLERAIAKACHKHVS